MRSQLINNLYSHLSFWRTKYFFDQKISFKLFTNFHLIRNRWNKEKNSFSILSHTVNETRNTIIYSLGVIIVIELLARVLSFFVTYSSPSHIGEDQAGLLLSTIVTVNGVFLGLYFTALSAVAGNMFIRAPENLQTLFLRERQGKQYVDTVVSTTVIGIFYLLVKNFGYEINGLALVFLSILVVYAVVRFISLGARAFYFIHPVEASLTINNTAVTALDNVMVNHVGWNKNYLQDHYRKQALKSLETYKSLIDFSIDVIHPSEQQFVDISKNIGHLLGYYLTRKKMIPTESLWFTTQYKHQNWLLADSSEVTVALNTGTSLNPKSSKDSYWFERECLKAILRIFDYLIGKNEWQAAHSCLEVIVWVIEVNGKDFFYDVVQQALELIQDSFNKLSRGSRIPKDEGNKEAYLAIIDTFGRIPISISLGLLLYIDKKTSESIRGEIQQINWLSDSSIYNLSLPGKLLVDIENTAKNFRLEYKIEGKQISPDWYLTSITTQRYLFHLEKYYRYVVELNSKFFEANVDQLKTNNEYISAAQLCERWLEFTHKNLRLGWKVTQLITECGSLKKVTDLPWTIIEDDKEKALLQKQNHLANDNLVALLPIISTLPEQSTKGLPDYFGKAFMFGVMAAHEASLDNNHERLQKIFPVVFIGALSAHQNLLKELDGWTIDSKIIFSSEPLEDLLTLSGFIKIYSELFANPALWAVCQNVWDLYLQQVDSQPFLKKVLALEEYRDASGYLMPRAILRTNWDMQLRQKLQNLGLNVNIFSYHYSDQDLPINHNSPLIRVISRQPDILTANAKEIFFATYLSQHSAANELDFPDRWEIREQIEKEEGRTQVEPT